MPEPTQRSMDETFEVDVIQFLMPNGKQKLATTRLPESHKEQYRQMIVCGCRFEAEQLTTGEVSVTISDGEGDVDISITRNGPAVQNGMIAMLERAKWESEDA